MKRLSFDPLAELVDGRGGFTAVVTSRGLSSKGTEYETLRRVYVRAGRSGLVSQWWADRFCIRFLGTDPCLIWGAEWWALDRKEAAA